MMPSGSWKRQVSTFLPADTPVLSARFADEFHQGRGAADVPSRLAVYQEWLRDRGFERETRHMTTAGLGFFKDCLEKKNSTRTPRK
jgi:hypothetical protein